MHTNFVVFLLYLLLLIHLMVVLRLASIVCGILRLSRDRIRRIVEIVLFVVHGGCGCVKELELETKRMIDQDEFGLFAAASTTLLRNHVTQYSTNN